jgi:hypothetical protein
MTAETGDDVVELDNARRHLPRRGLAVACRDCGLVHRLSARIVNGQVFIAAERLSGATRSRRRDMQALPRRL